MIPGIPSYHEGGGAVVITITIRSTWFWIFLDLRPIFIKIYVILIDKYHLNPNQFNLSALREHKCPPLTITDAILVHLKTFIALTIINMSKMDVAPWWDNWIGLRWCVRGEEVNSGLRLNNFLPLHNLLTFCNGDGDLLAEISYATRWMGLQPHWK